LFCSIKKIITDPLFAQAAGKVYHAGKLSETAGKFPAWRVFDTILFKSYLLPALSKPIIFFST